MPTWSDAVLLNPGGSLSVKHERIAEIIKDLDDSLELAYIPENQRSVFDKHPFAVIQRKPGRPPYVVMTMPENEVDERVIAKLIQRDTHRGATIDRLDAEHAARQLVIAKEHLEQVEEQRDFVHSVLRSPLNVYRHNGAVYRG